MNIDFDNNRITGVMVQYYTACKTELWFFANNISYNDEDDDIRIGRLLHKNSFENEKKEVQIDNCISIDYIKNDKKEVVIHEIKKSSKLLEPVRDQVLFYIWFLKKKGISSSAVITCPKERKKQKITLSKDEEVRIENILEDIKNIISLPRPPPPKKKLYCKKCSYFHLCWC
jgi:CRISPR-associated exonuclease Cas4